MSHPIFARLDDQVRLIESELANLVESKEKSDALREREPSLYFEWTHRAALAEGVRAVYKGIEDVMSAIANEIDGYAPPSRSANWHELLVNQMAVDIEGIRDALLDAPLHALVRELRQFRHRVHHGYALHLELGRLLENYERCRHAVPRFRKAYDRLSKQLQATPGESKPGSRAGRKRPGGR